MATTTILGSTGMTGTHILSTLLALPSTQVSSITTISRRAPKPTPTSSPTSPSLTTHIESNTAQYSTLLTTPQPPQILFSALATTRAAAGSFEKQYALEHDLNITLARAVREHPTSPTHTYVLISATGVNLNSYFPYTRMKAEIERDILALDFAHTVILRPGLIGGRREESRPAEAVIRWVADTLGAVSGGRLKDFWTQDADVIGRAAVRAGLRAQRGELVGKVTILSGKDIMELGRDKLTEEERQGK
ncbi:Protein fmp52, mitochondrial [Neophaeococcomyces mojaviensis]|uniref:Protein fmp52, mitochondrial n=1 Tax=Neophaeococcomyces mojaviensis TaxID=3383035 RepID=A0ACC3AEF1_9EURO|nr:Protein fmp52, mitochondrial [Knufia sp. JES_112]